MNSFAELNAVGASVIEVDDTRDATVIFDKDPLTSTLETVVNYTGLTNTFEPSINIEEIRNYSTANVRVRITVITGGTNPRPGSSLNFGTLPNYMALAQVDNVYTIAGLRNSLDWDIIKNFIWTFPANYATASLLYIKAEILYFDQTANSEKIVDWIYYDLDHFFISGASQGIFSITSSVQRIRSVSVSMNSTFTLTPNLYNITMVSSLVVNGDVTVPVNPMNAIFTTTDLTNQDILNEIITISEDATYSRFKYAAFSGDLSYIMVLAHSAGSWGILYYTFDRNNNTATFNQWVPIQTAPIIPVFIEGVDQSGYFSATVQIPTPNIPDTVPTLLLDPMISCGDNVNLVQFGSQFEGRTSSTLASSISASSTSLTLASAANFTPTNTLVIDNEIIRFTGKSNNTLTGLTRGFNNTTAASHSSGAVVYSSSSNSYGSNYYVTKSNSSVVSYPNSYASITNDSSALVFRNSNSSGNCLSTRNTSTGTVTEVAPTGGGSYGNLIYKPKIQRESNGTYWLAFLVANQDTPGNTYYNRIRIIYTSNVQSTWNSSHALIEIQISNTILDFEFDSTCTKFVIVDNTDTIYIYTLSGTTWSLSETRSKGNNNNGYISVSRNARNIYSAGDNVIYNNSIEYNLPVDALGPRILISNTDKYMIKTYASYTYIGSPAPVNVSGSIKIYRYL